MKKNLYSILLLIILVSINLELHAQIFKDSTIRNISKFSMFREPSYILIGGGLGNMEPLIFEGNLAPYFMIGINKDVKWGMELSPRIILRMYNKYSHPIRTPSFIPKVTIFYQLVDSKNKKRDMFIYFSWFHHSNGQDGYFYNSDSTTINTKTGSFSTNWIEGGVYLSRPDPYVPFTSNDFKLYVAYNYSQDKELNNRYGLLRFFFDGQNNVNLTKFFRIYRQSYNNSKFTLKQTIRLGWISGNLIDSKTIDNKRIILQYTLAFKPAFLNDVSIFAQYNYGQDYYNIYFDRTLNVIRFGIASSANIFN
jgi:hypothetical protein